MDTAFFISELLFLFAVYHLLPSFANVSTLRVIKAPLSTQSFQRSKVVSCVQPMPTIIDASSLASYCCYTALILTPSSWYSIVLLVHSFTSCRSTKYSMSPNSCLHKYPNLCHQIIRSQYQILFMVHNDDS